MLDYRKKVVIRSIRSFVVAMIVLALPGIIMGLFRTKMLWWTVLEVFPFVMMIKNIIGIITWKLTTATIEWVELVNNLDQPYTVAHIKYCAEDRVERDVSVMIEHYGDYEEGIEPELENMLQRNQALYTGRTLPLFYSPKKPEEYRVFLEDAFIQ